jgi:hypothetical protein
MGTTRAIAWSVLIASAAAACGAVHPVGALASKDAAADATPADGADARSSAAADATPADGRSSAADAGTDVRLVVAELAPLFASGPRPACEFSSPLAVTSRGQPEILIATADGIFTALDSRTGVEVWRVALTAPAGLSPNLVAPPALFGQRVIFAWQDVMADWTRVNHHVGVLDLDARALDPTFASLTLAGSQPTFDGAASVDFLPAHAFSRAAVVHVDVPDRVLGLGYVSFGNVRDLQPWHGWLFEIDLDAWQADGAAAAVSGTLVTTPESDCGAENGDGARQMVCGGGLWAAMGPTVVADDTTPDGFSLLVPTGNGILDPTRRDFANGILRVGRGLGFAPGCDQTLCDPFDPTSPTDACAGSCDSLFIPRLLSGQLLPRGPNDACVGLTLFQCYAALDWDLGASSPTELTLPGGPTLIVQPGKDGAVYLMDGGHLGTLYDRAQIMAGCGEGGGACSATWAGTMVTKAAIATIAGVPIALVPTFVEDDVHPAGLQALDVTTAGGTPHLSARWRAPPFDGPESVAAFRGPPSGVTVVDVSGEPFAAVVDTSTAPGTLYWIRVRDGAILQRVALTGSGQRYETPLAAGGVLYVPSCEHTGNPSFEEGPSSLEAFTIATSS